MKIEALNPWKELTQVNRPSIFLNDQYFRARNNKGTIQNEEGLGYKQFGMFTRAKERQPNKHEKGATNATAKTT
jgi:hypothetical protein